MLRQLLPTGCSAIALALSALPAIAQEATADTSATAEETGGLAEITVTAQRRQERLQDVPIAISALTASQLETRGITSVLGVAQSVPNLTAMNNTALGSANTYFLRGLGSTESIATFDPPVGTYVDDVYLSRQNANNLSLFDVERVEVLRGPQGTLFGRNTTGGAINTIMREPGKDFGGFAEVGYGKYDKKLVRASLDVPLAETFSVKISGYWQDDDGYAKNITTGQTLNDDDGWGVRLAMKGELSPSVTWVGSYLHVAADGENFYNSTCRPTERAICDGRYISTGLRTDTTAFTGLGIVGRKANYTLGNQTDTDLITSKFDIGVGDIGTLTLITGYLSQVQQYALDFFDGRGAVSPSLANAYPAILGLPRGGFTYISDMQASQFSQEAKLSGSVGNGLIDYVAGVYFINEDVRTDYADVLGTAAAPNALLLADRIMRNSTEAIAGYVQADVNVGPLKFTGGIRYTDETKTFSLRDNRAICQVATPPASCLFDANLIVPANGSTVLTPLAIPRRIDTKLWTPRFAVNFKPSNDVLVYASATKGFKSGGWNARETAPSRFLPFGPERVWSYEAGFKADLFDRKVRANVTVFQVDVSDQQVLSGLINPATGGLSFITRNFADYRNRGVEAEFTFAPARGVDLYANIGYSDDKYIMKQGQPATDIYGIQSVEAQLGACQAALAAGKVAGGGNTPATLPSIANCASGIVNATGGLAEPVRTPDWSVAFGGSYTMDLADSGWTFVPSISANWRSEMETATANFSIYSGAITAAQGTFPNNPLGGEFIAGSYSGPAWVVNGGVAIVAPENRMRVSLECSNCFDNVQVQSALGNYSYYNQPMMWMVRAKYNF